MNVCHVSLQEEESLAFAAVCRLGDPTAHEVAQELGVEVIRRTLWRLVDTGRLVKRVRHGQGVGVWVFSVRQPRSRIG